LAFSSLRRHLVEQRLLVLEVPVEGGSLHVQFPGDRAQRQAVQAHLVQQAQRGVRDPAAVQGLASFRTHA
jgi:hypothetical protein